MVKRESQWKSRKDAPVAVTLYETTAVRKGAVHFFHDLQRQFPDDELEVKWWLFADLDKAESAERAAKQAADADLIVFAVIPEGDLPRTLKLWIEGWLGERREREGAIVGLVDGACEPFQAACFKEIYLRHIAHRAGMDYLSHAQPTVAKAIPDSLDSFNARARQMTSVLDEILHTPHPQPPPL